MVIQNMENKKYDKLLKTGEELFIRHGIRRVTIEEICREAGVSKMTFYKFFGNKAELVKKIITNIFNDGYKNLDETMSKDIPFTDKFNSILRYKWETTSKYKGILSEIMTMPELQPLWLEIFTKNSKSSLEIFEIGKKEGAIDENIKIEFLQYIMEQLYVMWEDEKLKKIFPDMIERAIELTNIVFYGIIKDNKKT